MRFWCFQALILFFTQKILNYFKSKNKFFEQHKKRWKHFFEHSMFSNFEQCSMSVILQNLKVSLNPFFFKILFFLSFTTFSGFYCDSPTLVLADLDLKIKIHFKFTQSDLKTLKNSRNICKKLVCTAVFIILSVVDLSSIIVLYSLIKRYKSPKQYLNSLLFTQFSLFSLIFLQKHSFNHLHEFFDHFPSHYRRS